MVPLPKSVRMPLGKDADGVIRVGGTRVTLDQVVRAFQRGESPAQIAEQYPVLDLADVYHVIGYYLSHRAELDAYLAEKTEQASVLRQQWEAEHPPLTRTELQARRGRTDARDN